MTSAMPSRSRQVGTWPRTSQADAGGGRGEQGEHEGEGRSG